MFSKESNPALVLEHALQEITSRGGFRTTEEIRSLLRQAGLVSLWFYLKFIAGYSGPYNELNSDLHVDMCNFRQRVATTPGIKAASFLPRSALKSTIMSHGANGWELLRDPNLRIGCTSEVADRAQAFVSTTISTFQDNELHKWLYPEYVKANRNDVELVLENRTRKHVEPSLKAITAGGSTQGIHLDLFDCDDIVGDNMLNAEHVSTADMYRMTNWLHNNLRTLVVKWSESRVIVAGTRWGVDDPYERIMLHSREQVGFWDDEDYPVDENGDWVTYYRPALQNGESIWPDVYTVEGLNQMAVDDPWLFHTQYMNRAYSARPGDFGQYTPGKVAIRYDNDRGFLVDFPDGTVRALSSADLVAAGDPASSKKQASIRTSKSATCVVARWSDDTVAVLEADKGFVEPTRFFDWLYAYKAKYGVGLRNPYIEAAAGFKSFPEMARREALIRGKELNVQPIAALGDKETTIRNILQPYLARNKLFVNESVYTKVVEELKIFPSARMDMLDALKIAVFKTVRPDRGEESWDEDEDDEPRRPGRRDRVSSVSGY